MKKTCKILFLVVLIIMLVFTFSAYVDAAETIDYSTYPDLDTDTTTTQNNNSNTNNTDTNTNTEKDVKAEKTNTNTNNENKANIATTSHPQTGVYNNKVCILIATITIIAIVVAYVKIKKYNY